MNYLNIRNKEFSNLIYKKVLDCITNYLTNDILVRRRDSQFVTVCLTVKIPEIGKFFSGSLHTILPIFPKIFIVYYKSSCIEFFLTDSLI